MLVVFTLSAFASASVPMLAMIAIDVLGIVFIDCSFHKASCFCSFNGHQSGLSIGHSSCVIEQYLSSKSISMEYGHALQDFGIFFEPRLNVNHQSSFGADCLCTQCPLLSKLRYCPSFKSTHVVDIQVSNTCERIAVMLKTDENLSSISRITRIIIPPSVVWAKASNG